MPTVILVSIDGLRPDAIRRTNSPNLKSVEKNGAATMQARSVMPSMTLPCHISMFHSVSPERHGILTNHWQPFARPLPGLVEVAHQHSKRSAFFYNWEQLRDLSRPGHLEYSCFINSAEVMPPDPGGDHLVVERAIQFITSARPDFAFVYLGTLDVFGHMHGWMSSAYLEQLEVVDEALGLLLAERPAGSTLLVQSDHGGHDRTHGTDRPEDMLIPWLITGPRIRPGHTITTPVSLLDTAPTLARLLNLPVPVHWEGRCVEEILV